MSLLSDKALDHLRAVTDAPDLHETRYRVEEQIGRGGMGAVYRAWDRELDRYVAIKVMDAGFEEGGQNLVLTDEARILAKLEHPGIVPVYDAGMLPDRRAYFAMRLVEGTRWDEALEHEPSLPNRLRSFEKVCETVAVAHSRGVIHGDLKPHNVMVSGYGQVFVMDWGLARVPGQASDGAWAGTPNYMAPEQQGAGASVLTDVFALGVVLKDVLRADRPKPLLAIAKQASDPSPDKRYQSVEALARDLRGYLDRLPVTAYRENALETAERFFARNRVLLLLLFSYVLVRFLLFFFSGH